jgi:hypothetical protein
MCLVLRLRIGGAMVAVAALAAACAHGASSAVDGASNDAGVDGGGLGLDGSVTLPDAGASDTGGTAPCGTVVINELQTEGASANDEFVELANPGSCAVSLAGYELRYRSKADGASGSPLYTFGAGASIASGGRVLVATGSLPGKIGTLTPGMAKDGGQVGLVDDKKQLVDGVAYGAVSSGAYLEGNAAPAPPASGSIARKPDGTDTDDNASDFTVASTPTPGAAN